MASQAFGFKVVGGDFLARNLMSLSDANSRKEQILALRKGAVPIKDEMESRAPTRKPGSRGPRRDVKLKSSMSISTVRDSDNSGDTTVAVGPSKDAFWGFFQEVGTVNHGPQPFGRPSFDARHKQAQTIIADAFWARLRKRIKPPPSAGRSPGGGGFL